MTRPGTRRRPAAAWLTLVFAVLFLGMLPRVEAVEVPALYTARVVLDAERPDAREAAYVAALGQVLLRVAGPELAADAAARERMFPEPRALVVQFRPGQDGTLLVSFDGTAIERTLRAAGETVWGRDRPLTIVWLAVDWGQGEREIIGADDPERTIDAARSIDRNRLLRQRVLDMAERRGLPVLFPLLDTDDLKSVSFSDIWGGFDEPLLEASSRYDAPSVLVGRIRPESAERNRWTYYFAGEAQSLNGEPELVMNQVADRLAAEFAIRGNESLQAIDLRISGVDSVSAYGSVQRMLAGLPVVESFSIRSVSGDEIAYHVLAYGGPERLRRALRFNGLIEQDRFATETLPDDGFDAQLEFFYGPDQAQP